MIRLSNVVMVGALLLAGACDKKPTAGTAAGSGSATALAAAPAFKDGAEGLTSLFAAARKACDAKDFAAGAAIVRSMVVDDAALKKVLKDDAPPAVATNAKALGQQLPADAAKAACAIAPPNRTEIKIHTATTEEIIEHKQGTPGGDEFPGGAQKVAQLALKPGITFYEVETTEPGHDSGTRFHLMFFDGTQWRMLGGAWRGL